MQSLPQASAPAREYRAIVPCDGYVHKFRLEAQEEAAAGRRPQPDTTPAVNLGSLLGKFVLSGLALIGIAAAGARAGLSFRAVPYLQFNRREFLSGAFAIAATLSAWLRTRPPNVPGRGGVQNYEQESGKRTKIFPAGTA